MKTICVLLVTLFAVLAGVQAASEQDFVVVGHTDIAQSLSSTPSLELPTILMEVESDADVESEILSPFMQDENKRIAADQALLSNMELFAHAVGARDLAQETAEKQEHEVTHIEHSLLSTDSHAHHDVDHEIQMLKDDEHLPTALLESAPIANTKISTGLEAETEEMEREVAMVELSSSVSRAKLDPKNDYAFLDDPKTGGQPTVLKNLKGLDIYVVNTPVTDNENEIHPVKPPRPMSAAMREKARLAAIMRKQLIHDVPQPRAAIKPKTRINTLSAYESSLVDSRPLAKLSRRVSLENPIAGGMGAQQLNSVGASGARFAQLGLDSVLPGTGGAALPVFPKDPTAAPLPVRAFGAGSSFDNRDGPPALLDDLLPLKAVLVEDLDPLGVAAKPTESKPNW